MKTLLLAALLFSLPTLAADIKMLEIKSDVDGNQTATILIQALTDSTIQNVVYSNPIKPTQTWTVSSLNQNKVVIIEKKGVAVVEISAKTLTKNSFLFNINFLYKYGIFGSDRRLKQLKMFYVAPSNLYQTMDVDTNKIITNAIFIARMEGDKQKGIERIDTY
ncbi:MAG: hypothetical protein H7Z71_02050 [Moraxellaceae bacterium]|nr:hypothetical protein [Pseudobdellovibrionaceae bacterium]